MDRETRRQCDTSQCKLYRIRHGEDICSSVILTDDPSVNLVCTADDANKTVGREFEDWPASIDQTKTILVALSAYARARIRVIIAATETCSGSAYAGSGWTWIVPSSSIDEPAGRPTLLIVTTLSVLRSRATTSKVPVLPTVAQ